MKTVFVIYKTTSKRTRPCSSKSPRFPRAIAYILQVHVQRQTDRRRT